MRYYIADCHFFHESLINRMDNRGFSSMEEMHEYMITRWNEKVRKVDDVVILGDFSIGKGVQTAEILARLNGNKYLIQGNHDKFLGDRKFDDKLFKWIKPYMEFNDNKRKVVLSHYPVFCYNGQYRKGDDGQYKTYMLYGHVHDTYDEVLVNRFIYETRESQREVYGTEGNINIPCQMINCFCMYSDYTPLSLDEWIELDTSRRNRLNENRS